MSWWLVRRSRGKNILPLYFECDGREAQANTIGGIALGLKSGYSVLPVNPPPAKLQLSHEARGHKFYWEVPKI